MNIQLLLGIIIGAAFVLVCFGIFLAIPARRGTKHTLTFNEKSLDQLTIRNTIAHEQIALLWKIARYMALKDTREDDPKLHRERIATAMLASILSNYEMPTDGYAGDVLCAIRYADELIAELDKPEKP